MLKNSFIDGKYYNAPIYGIVNGRVMPVKYNVISGKPFEMVRILYYSGVITDNLPKYLAGEVCHPETKRARY